MNSWHRLLNDLEFRLSLRKLAGFLVMMTAVVCLYAVGFHAIMIGVEGKSFHWFTGIYWTLETMTTLGLGDIFFESWIGQLYTVVVLMTGILMVFVVLPFAVIRYLYTPYKDAIAHEQRQFNLLGQISGHVVVTSSDAIKPGLLSRLRREDIPHAAVEDGLADASESYRNLRADSARLIVVNDADVKNYAAVLAIRQASSDVPIAATCQAEDAADMLARGGANHVLPLKRWLGEQLANRINSASAGLCPIGSYEDLKLAEFPVHNTPIAGNTIRETGLRVKTGVSIVGVRDHGKMEAPRPDRLLTPSCVLLVMGRPEQLDSLDDLLQIYDINPNPVIVVGAGTVGRSAARTLKSKGLDVHMVDNDPSMEQVVGDICSSFIAGDATHPDVLIRAGIKAAPAILISTNDDATNIYLTGRSRQLNPDLRIVSRITHERNVELISKAGADFMLSYATLGLDVIMSILQNRSLIVLGEGVDVFTRPVPSMLHGKSLADSGIGASTGLNVVALRTPSGIVTQMEKDTVLERNSDLVMIGSDDQSDAFKQTFG